MENKWAVIFVFGLVCIFAGSTFAYTCPDGRYIDVACGANCAKYCGNGGATLRKSKESPEQSQSRRAYGSAIGSALSGMMQGNEKDEEYDAKMEELRQLDRQRENKSKIEDEQKQSVGNGVSAKLLYRCLFEALQGHEVTGWFSVWETERRGRYIVAAEPKKSPAIWAKGFGTPKRGNFSLTLSDKVVITIADNGWGTTSLDRIVNKNSLYGEVSPEKNKAGGGCVYLKDRPSEADSRMLDVSN